MTASKSRTVTAHEIFNTSTNAFELINAVFVVREVEKQLQIFKESAFGKQYGVCVHGNRLIEHVVLQNIRKNAGFSETVIDISSVSTTIKSLLDTIIPLMTNELNVTYEDSYPANVFKNLTKSKAISEVLKSAIKL